MRALVVYESMWGNTREIAQAVADGLGGTPVHDVDHVTAEEAARADLLVLGGPTHAFSLSRPGTRHDARVQGATEGSERRGLREWIDELPQTMPARVATFDTRVTAVRHLPGSAARSAARHLRTGHDGRVVARESFYVEATPGPLAAGEVIRAREWGRRLAASQRFAAQRG
ncbi:MAG: flavodoxin family protein [Phycicoccus sp.]